MRDIEVRRNSGLSGKVRFTMHALHTPLVRCACPFIEATHIEHYRNTAVAARGCTFSVTGLADQVAWHMGGYEYQQGEGGP